MNSLFPIPLLGAGSEDVESFPSYLHRAAINHGIYTGELLRHVDQTAKSHLDQGTLIELPTLPNYIRVPELVRPSRTTNMLVDFMEKSTGQALKQSTLWFLDRALGRSADEVFKTFRWCPECIQEMLFTGQQAYFKLSWQLNAITECPLHGTPFLSQCARCNSTQDSYIRQKPIHICVACDANIWDRGTPLTQDQIKRSWDQNGNDVSRLLRDLSELKELDLPEYGVKKSLQLIYKHYLWDGRFEEIESILPPGSLSHLLNTKQPVSLKVARRFAYRLGISLLELMSGQAHQTSAVLNSQWFCQLPPDFMEVKSRQKRDHLAIMRRIRRLRQKATYPLPLSQIAEASDVSVGYLEYRYPSLVRQIVAEHQRHIDRERTKVIQNAQLVAMRYFFEDQSTSLHKSRKEAYRVLREETGLPKFVLKRAIEEAYRALHG